MLTAIDVFCGAGGLSYGFKLAGFRIAAAVDFDAVAVETYRRQHPDTKLFVKDIRRVRGKQLLAAAGGRCDLLIGAPSCQGFSTHGRRDPNDPRNYLFREFVRLVRELRPAWVVMENVKGLLTYEKGRYRDEIHRSFKRAGYRVESRVLRSADYGVPQLRERLIFIATRTKEPITFPVPTHAPRELAEAAGLRPYVTVGEALGDLNVIGDSGESWAYKSKPTNDFQRYVRRDRPRALSFHRARPVSKLAFGIIRRVPQGAGLRAIPPRFLAARFRRMRTTKRGRLRRDCTTLYYRLSWNRPSYTITCYFTNVSSGPFVHPTENRALTPREAARLQSFPDSYEFFDKRIQRQIGNAVPPLMAFAIAGEIATKFSTRRSGRMSYLRSA